MKHSNWKAQQTKTRGKASEYELRLAQAESQSAISAENIKEEAHKGIAYLAKDGQTRPLTNGNTIVFIDNFTGLPEEIRLALASASRYADKMRLGGDKSIPSSFTITKFRRNGGWLRDAASLEPERDTVTCELKEFKKLCDTLEIRDLNAGITNALHENPQPILQGSAQLCNGSPENHL